MLDTSAYIPADVARSTKLLGDRVGQYLLVSTISVYAKMDTPNQDESAPLAQLANPNVTEVTGETYGGLKALCEAAALKQMPGRSPIVRPGLIVGPGDNTDRFTYWPARADRGGEILAPGTAMDPTQFIDVRDLAAFLLHLLDQETFGTFNADAPAGKLTMGELLAASQRAAGKTSTVDVGARGIPRRSTTSPRGRTCPCGFRRWANTPASAASAARRRRPRG